MRNLVVLRDQCHRLVGVDQPQASIASISFDKASSKIFVLLSSGTLLCFRDTDDAYELLCRDSACIDAGEVDNGWFDLTFIAGTGSAVAVSHSGSIVSFEQAGDGDQLIAEQIGAIEGGIAAASWSPDQSCITILTNNNTMLCMSSTWDVLQEIPVPDRVTTGASGGLSWRGDGEGLAVLSTDAEDGMTRVRMYSKQLELASTGRNVADGPASVMKGVGKVVAFATNGSYVAVCQEQKTGAGKNKLQVALVEKNGLRHGDFDLQLPPPPAGWERWEECSLDWDLPTTLLAVGLRAVRSSFAAEGTTDSKAEEEQGRPGLVQLYYRGNYHWYLKQQWAGDGLRFLGFDEELVNRFYLSQVSGAETAAAAPVLRVVDLTWDISGSLTPDSSVAVVDGRKLLFTPLGINNIPPPMCKTSVALSADSSAQGSLHCTRSSCFWQPVGIAADAQQAAWGFAALAEDDTFILLLTGDSTGSILTQRLMDLRAALNGIAFEEALQVMYSAVFRSIAVTQQGDQLRIVLLGSEPCALHTSAGQGGLTEATSDILLIASLSLSTLVAHDAYVVKLPTGSATRVCAVPHSPFCVGVGIIRAGSDGSEFEVYRVNIESAANSAVELVATLPEQCTHLSFISDREARGEAVPVALSLRNRLYCGESLLSSGVSSFCYNEAFGVMMFATLGTRPHLHFSSILRLKALDALQHAEDQESAECAEPRPIERGARLVVSAEGSSRVVMQLPRGNLETIEPRPLILLRAQQLLHADRLLDCLVLLRKQRVDLNYLVDYSPRIFFRNIESFVKAMLSTSHDLISLLITALEPVDVTEFKYPLDRNCQALQEARDMLNFTGAGKVNRTCTAVRNVLLPLLHATRTTLPVDDVACSKILQPILCTYARQQPQQLVEALSLIRLCCTAGGVVTSAETADSGEGTEVSLQVAGGTAVFASVMAQVSIKYLAFLAEGSVLFDAALGTCDFDMTRAVARQCQMDPRAYLPLVEGFELLGRGFDSYSPQVALMHFKVNVHLKRHESAVHWTVELLRRLHRARTSLNEEVARVEISGVVKETRGIIKAENLHTYALPRLAGLEAELQLDSIAVIGRGEGGEGVGVEHVICRLLSDLRLEYGQLCASKMEYAEAIAAILATQPVCALEAIEVAKQMGNWQLAISIAGRHQHDPRYKGMASEISPVSIAQQIVAEFRENLEQSEACGNLHSTATEAGAAGDAADDKVAEAARLCVDYCDDHEAAISILTTAQRWLPALQLAMRYSRKDLFSEVASAARVAAEEMITILPKRALKVKALVDEVATLWENPAERLSNVASTDITLMDELNGVDAANQRQVDDSMSVYSAATQQSTFSRSSARSDSSRFSTKSGSSVVSVLSNLSAASGLSGAASEQGKQSAFSIEGLDHSLLSRGTVTANNDPDGPGTGKDGKRSKKQYRRDQTERRQKRIERSKAKGASKDVWGLRREGAACEELVGYARQLVSLTKACRELCEALQLVNEAGDLALAVAVQGACDTYMRFVQQNPPRVAPNYPPEWLVKRTIADIRHFQDPESLAAALAATQQRSGAGAGGAFGDLGSQAGGAAALPVAGDKQTVTSWWDIAAAGLRAWYATTRLTLTTTSAR